MSIADVYLDAMTMARERTLGLLENVEKEGAAALGWRPGPGRAHIAWQLTHVGITEELFATERLVPGSTPAFAHLVPRFKGGSTPDDEIPTIAEIRKVLADSRTHLTATLRTITDDRLGEIPPAFAARGLTLLHVLKILFWHEAHHQGQAHITLNLFKAAHPK